MKKLIALITFLVLPIGVLAANEVTVQQDTTLELPNDSSTYTMKSGSQYDSMSVGGSTFTFSLSQGGRVTLRSGDRKKFDNTAASPVTVSLDCNASDSSITLAIDPPFTTTSVNVTPTGTCGAGSGGAGGGGGGGGGGGSSSYTPLTQPPPAQTVDKVALLKQQITETQKKILERLAQTKASPRAIAAVSTAFSRDLNPGARSDDVRRLQQILASDKTLYPDGTVSGFFGALTRAAVLKFQLKYGVVKSASELGAGRVGPKTRAKLNEVFAAAAPQAPAAVSAPATPKTTAPAAVSKSQVSAIQEQIKAIQAKLIQAQIKAIQEKLNSLKK